MKKIFTLDTVITSLVGAIGYGAGYVIPSSFGVNMFLSCIICMICGMICDMAADKVVFNSYIQKTAKRRYAVFTGIVLLFFVVYAVMVKYFAHSLWTDFGSELFFMVGIPVIAFCFSLGIRYIKKYRLSKKYGSGESGFIFDKRAEEYLKDFIGENKELSEYTGKNPIVKTHSGLYVGKKDKNGLRFLGIPYAKAERWQKPIAVKASKKTYEAYYFGSTEIQPDSNHNILKHFKQDDDCLNLNIWTAKLEPDTEKPVLVYFHGGDGRYGGCANPTFYLGNLAKAIPEAVFVSINYRFGVLGVADFSTSGCADAKTYKDSTVLPLLDQIEALKWVRSNISAFGGNPENITVAGDGIGGTCICLLAAMKKAEGLFKRALILCASPFDAPSNNQIASMLGEKLLKEFKAKSVADLTHVTKEQLKDFSARNYDLLELPPKDGKHVPEDITKKYLTGSASGIEFIFGIAADDVSGWQAMLSGDISFEDMTESYYKSFIDRIGAEKANKIETLLKKYIQSGLNTSDAKKALMSDLQFKTCLLYTCKMLVKGGSDVRCFYWDVKGDIEKFTANSVSIVTAILGNSEIAEQMGYLHNQSITEIMQALVGKYIHGLSPELFNNELKGVSEIVWQKFNTDKKSVLHIQKDTIKMAKNVFSEDIRKLEKIVF